MDGIAPKRKSIRLKNFDYSRAGAYFVTICSHNKKFVFGRVEDDAVRLSELGRLIEECWQQITEHFMNATLDEYIIMPNHLHGIIVLSESYHDCRGAARSARETDSTGRGAARSARKTDSTGRGAACSTRSETSNMRPDTLSTIVRSFKSAATKLARESNLVANEPLWQRSFFERIIRNNDAMMKAREYIINNPLRWHLDKENPDRQQL